MKFEHPSLNAIRKKKLVYTAMSKHTTFFKDHISKFVLERGCVPLNPFAIPYFMLDTVPRDVVREANNNLLMRADELWVFGPVSDGLLAEIKLAKQLGKPIRYFTIVDSREIKEISKEEVEFEDKELEKFRSEI